MKEELNLINPYIPIEVHARFDLRESEAVRKAADDWGVPFSFTVRRIVREWYDAKEKGILP